jgi:hypothetical protein
MTGLCHRRQLSHQRSVVVDAAEDGVGFVVQAREFEGSVEDR